MSKKKFTISIGEYGIIVALHNGKDVQNKILVAALNDSNKEQLAELFIKNKSVPTYILIDTNSQNYKRRTYPPVGAFDFHKIAKRDADKENDTKEKSFKGYYAERDKVQKKWDCIFVSTLTSDEIEKWSEFLLGLPNYFAGIYMLPIETYHLANAIFEIAKTEHDISDNKNQILSFIIQNKVSGVRQTIFYNKTIIFTRVVNYDFENKNFKDRFEQDLFRANEYLKMIFPHLKAQDVTIINILSEDIIEKIKHPSNHDFKFINYSPYEVAMKTGLTNVITKNTSNFSDIIISNFFANNQKKILRFTNPRISLLSRLSAVIKSIWIFNYIATALILLTFAKIAFQEHGANQQLTQLKNDRARLEKQLQDVSNAALSVDGEADIKDDDKNLMADQIIDFGKIDEILSKVEVNISDVFNQLSYIKKYDAIAESFSYQIPSFTAKATSFNTQGSFALNGTISDKSGDVEILFRKFDNLSLDTKNRFPGYNVKFSEISKNVDFSKKYYSFPFDLTIENKK